MECQIPSYFKRDARSWLELGSSDLQPFAPAFQWASKKRPAPRSWPFSLTHEWVAVVCNRQEVFLDGAEGSPTK